MAREYSIWTSLAGTDLQVVEEGQPERHFDLHRTTEQGKIREAEDIINREFYGRLEPFPGFDWQRTNPNGWRTTDHDYRG